MKGKTARRSFFDKKGQHFCAPHQKTNSDICSGTHRLNRYRYINYIFLNYDQYFAIFPFKWVICCYLVEN